MGYKPKAPEIMPEPNVVPMADIMLVLLIIFMVVTPMLQKGASVTMAPTENPIDMKDADREDAILIAITRNGKIFLGTRQIPMRDIPILVGDELATRADKTVYVKSDARARYGDVVKIVDEVRALGVDQIGLLTEQRRRDRFRRPPLSAPTGGSGVP